MTTDFHDAAFIKRVIHMGLHLFIDGNATMSKYGFGLVAADAVQAVHDKVEQLVGLLHLANDGFVIIAGHSVVVATIGHIILLYK